MLDPFGHAHGRPQALTAIVGAHGGIEGGERGVGVEKWGAAENHLFIAVFAVQIHRAAHRGQWAVPAPQLAIDEVFALLDLTVEAVFFPGCR